MTNADVTISIQGTSGSAATVKIAKDANITGDEALGRVIQAINSKSADTGVTAFLNDTGTGVDLRATMTSATADATAVAVTGQPNAGLAFATSSSPAAADLKGIDGVDITTQKGAWEALQHIDSAINKVNESRGQLGAIQTRFEKTVENIDIQNENLSAARGRIVDTDFAQETANLSRTQILQQAGTAMVAQANQLPQNVLSLLR